MISTIEPSHKGSVSHQPSPLGGSDLFTAKVEQAKFCQNRYVPAAKGQSKDFPFLK